MKLDPITISVTALAVSAFSLILSTYRAGVDRRLQWEQFRGGIHARLTSRGVEILTMREELRRFPTDESNSLIQKLLRISEAIWDIRKILKRMETPPPFFASAMITQIAPIKSDLDDAEPIFEKLVGAIRISDMQKADKLANGLIERLCGSMKDS
jgi:hypothetical protein